MKHLGCTILIALTLALGMSALMAWNGTSTALAQDVEDAETVATASLPINVTMETEDGEIITLPLQVDIEDIAALLSLDPAMEVMQAFAELADQNVQTITVVAPYVLTSVAVSLVIEPVELPAPPIAAGESTADDEADAVGEGAAAEADDGEQPVAAPPIVPERFSTLLFNANLRISPRLDADVLGQLAQGAEVSIRGRNSDGEWLYLDDGSWVASSLVEDVPEDLPIVVKDADVIAETVPARVLGGTVILRSGPSTSEGSLGLYEEGALCAVINRTPDGTWLEVVTPDGQVGWMSANFLDVEEGLEDIPTVISSDSSAIRGMVVDDKGEGVDDINVVAMHTGDGNVPRMNAKTSSNGVFTFYMKPGDESAWTVRIAGVGCSSRIVNDRCQLFGFFALQPEANVVLPSEDVLTLVFETATSFIAGTVIDRNGEAVGDGYLVSAVREDGATTAGETSSTGKFVLPAADGTWTVSTSGGGTLVVDVPEGSAPEPVELPYQ